MKKLNYELKNICESNRDGGYESQKKRYDDLQLFASQLEYELGFPRIGAKSLKEKHVLALLNHWKAQKLAINTIKARMSRLRWWAKKIGKPNIIKPRNKDYGIVDRRNVSEKSKAIDIDVEVAKSIPDKYVVASLLLARTLGLRKEEAIKFNPSYADKGDYIQLKASWCKGGKKRTIPITTQAQRDALNFAHEIAGKGSLIPPELKYHQQKTRYEKQTLKVGFRRLHGLRHRYAQLRYLQLTGWLSPHAGGIPRKEMDEKTKEVDTWARLIISKELGHERLQIAATYLGS